MSHALNSYAYEPTISTHPKPLGEHALVGVSTFNSYFSIDNMEKLFLWTSQNYDTFNVFFMDGASKFNLMAMGYNEIKALKKTKSHDNNLRNRIIKSLTNIDFDFEISNNKIILLSNFSQDEKYKEIYKYYFDFFENNITFQRDCFEATKMMLSSKMSTITQSSLSLAVNYLLAELPFWFNTPDILGIHSSTFVYKDLSLPWQKICYNYGLLSSQQKIMVKSVTE